MLSYTEIQATNKARETHTKPLSVRKFDPEKPDDFFSKIPFLGDYVPEGWEDTGWATIRTPAFLAIGAFFGTATHNEKWWTRKLLDLQRSAPDHFGLGIVETGEFQVVIRIYKTDHRDFTHSGALTEEELSKVGAK